MILNLAQSFQNESQAGSALTKENARYNNRQTQIIHTYRFCSCWITSNLRALLYEDATKALKLYVCGFGLNVKPCGLTVATVSLPRTMVPAMVEPGARSIENLLRPALPSNDLVWPLPVSSVTVAGEARIATAQSVSLV
jgi:hypothetical protein